MKDFHLQTPTVTVELSALDALSTGLSIQTLAQTRPMPQEQRETYRRVGEQLESAARRELAMARSR